MLYSYDDCHDCYVRNACKGCKGRGRSCNLQGRNTKTKIQVNHLSWCVSEQIFEAQINDPSMKVTTRYHEIEEIDEID